MIRAFPGGPRCVCCPFRVFLVAGIMLASGAVVHAQVSSRVESGTLDEDDRRLADGEFADTYTVEGKEGQHLIIDLRSSDFDTFVQLHAVNGDGEPDPSVEWHNDDYEGSQSHSRLEVTLPSDGNYIVFATTYKSGGSGRYELTITTFDSRVETGTLSDSDSTLQSGEFYRMYEFRARTGDSVVLDLASDAFDTFLFVSNPDDTDFTLANDDFQSDAHRSQISFSAPRDATYQAYVTSYAAGEVGPYRLTISRPTAADLPHSGPRREQGDLAEGDQTLQTGEYADLTEFTGTPGRHLRVELVSDDFDTYLMVVDPRGVSVDNDDYNGESRRSVIEMDLTEVGTYRVIATSCKLGETGHYSVTLEMDENTPDAPSADVVRLESGDRREGRLEAGDSQVEEGRLRDQYSFQGTAGQRLIIRMSSTDLDPLLVLTTPDGSDLQFDDSPDGKDASIDFVIEQSGRYRLTATSYERGGTGAYALAVDVTADGDAAPPPADPTIPVPAERRVYGVFVGIADYPGEANDLSNTDDDARLMYDLIRRECQMGQEDGVLLINEEATVEAISSALTGIGGRAGADDLLLFFYSGHGSQSRERPADAFDPDGVHETIAVYDGEISDDDFAALLNASRAGICLVAIDACFSGGFAKDVVSAAGRMGIFSSEEDVLSAVPRKFKAGGYMSQFLVDAIGDHHDDADLDGNHEMTAFELSHYLCERYRDDVRSTKSKGGDGFISPGDNLSFQRLVIDRGGLRFDQVLFRWE